MDTGNRLLGQCRGHTLRLGPTHAPDTSHLHDCHRLSSAWQAQPGRFTGELDQVRQAGQERQVGQTRRRAWE